MADQKPSISDWLDAPSDAPLPQFGNEQAIGDWLDAPAQPQQQQPTVEDWLDAPDTPPTSNVIAGIASRASALGAGGLRAVGQLVEGAGDWLETNIPISQSLGLMTAEDLKGENTPLPRWSRDMAQAANGINYQPTVPWEKLKAEPTPGNIVTFMAEQGITSTPDMVAAILNPLAYGTALTGDIAQTRAQNKGLEEAGAQEVIEAAPAAAISALLERFGAMGIIERLGQSTAWRRILAAGSRELGTEFLQEQAEYGGETIGTDKPWTLGQSLERGAAGAIGGAGMGAAGRAAVELTVGNRPAVTPPPAADIPPPSGVGSPPAPGNPPASTVPQIGQAAARPSPPASDAGGTTSNAGEKIDTPENPPASPPPASEADAYAARQQAELESLRAKPTSDLINQRIGLRQKKGPPEGVMIEAVQDGYVFFRKADGSVDAAREGEFRRDLTLPPPSTSKQADATLVPQPPQKDSPLSNDTAWLGPEPPPIETGDINDFDPYAQQRANPKAPPKPSPQGAMVLPDTKTIATLRAAAAEWQKSAVEAERLAATGSPQAKTPQEIAAMRVEGAKALDEAARLEAMLTPRRASQDPTAATPEQMATKPLGALGRAAPAESEATTGPRDYPVTPAKAPPAPAQGALAPVAQSEATTGPQTFQVTPKAAPVAAQPELAPVAGSEAEKPQPIAERSQGWQRRLRADMANGSVPFGDRAKLEQRYGVSMAEINREMGAIAQQKRQEPTVPWQQRLRTLIGNRALNISNLDKAAKRLGVTPAELSAELSTIGQGKNAPIERIQGSVKIDKKTKQPVQSKMAGKWRYAPRASGNADEDLVDFVLRMGGIRPDAEGEIAARDLEKYRFPFKGKLINPNSPYTLQQMADAAMQEKFLVPTESGADYYGSGVGYQGGDAGGVGSTSANVERFKEMLTENASKSKRHYRRGSEPEIQLEGPTFAEEAERRKTAAREELRRIGIEPRGDTVEELENQVDEVFNATGGDPAIDETELGAFLNRNLVERMDQEAKNALEQAGYDEAWFEQEAGISQAEPAAARGVPESAGEPEPQPEGARPAAERPAGEPEDSSPRGLADEKERPLIDTAPSAKGVQQAREARHHGRKGTDVKQQDPGGMFALPEKPDTRQVDLEEAIAAKKAELEPIVITPVGTPGQNQTYSADVRTLLDKVPQSQRLSEAHRWIVANGDANHTEYGVFTEPDGSVAWAGTSNMDDQIAPPTAIDLHIQAGTLTLDMQHNHPKTGGPLSRTDMGTMALPGLRWVIAHGEANRFSAARVSDGFRAVIDRARSLRERVQAFESVKSFAVARSMEMNRPHYEAGRLSPMQTEVMEFAWRGMHEAGVIDYMSSAEVPGWGIPIIEHIATSLNQRLANAGYPLDNSNRVHRPAERIRTAEGLARISGQPATIEAENTVRPAADTRGSQGSLFEEGGQGDTAAARDTVPGSTEGTGGVLARLINDESGALTLPDWERVRAFFKRAKGPWGTTAAEAARRANAVRLGNPDTLRHMAYIGPYLLNAAHLSSMDKPSATYWNALLNRHHTKVRLEHDAYNKASPYFGLSREAKARVHKVLEYFRLYGINPVDSGRDIVVKIPDRKPPFGTARPVLSKANEIVALDKAETQAVLDLFEMFRDQWNTLHEAMAREVGYRGDWSEEGITAAIDDGAASRPDRKAAERAQKIWISMVENQRQGYMPLQRYGDAFIAVTPKVAEDDAGGKPTPVHYEFVKTTGALDRFANVAGGGSSKRIAERKAELARKYPADQYDITHGLVAAPAFEALNIPALQKALYQMNLKNQGKQAALIDELLRGIYEKRMAGSRKRSENIAGYDTDFEKAILDYIRQSSSVIARMSHRQDVDSAFDGTQSHTSKDVRDYWEGFTHHLEKEGGDYNTLRKLGFFLMMWGSPAGAAINLTQTPLATMHQLSLWAGLRAPGLAHGAMLEGLRAVRPSLGKGLQVNIEKLGRTAAERTMIRTLAAEGRLGPSLSNEFQGSEIKSSSPAYRPHSKILGGIWNWGSAMYNAAEEVSRVAAALSSFRAAQNPQMREKLAKVMAKDQMFQQAVGRRMDPIDIARWFTDETQFVGGKINRIPIMRNVGSLIFQFKNYPANYLRLLHKNFTQQGREGKIAGSMMLVSLLLVSGLMGAPFADDALKLADTVTSWVTGIDPNLEYQMRDFIANDMGWGDYAAEVMTHGVGRNLFGMDVGNRLGMGGLFPSDSITDTMPIMSAIVSRAQDYGERKDRGQDAMALADLVGWVGGKGGTDIMKAVAQSQEGINTQKGNILVRPEDVTLGQLGLRALGFQPTDVTRAQERAYMSERLSNATDLAKSRMLTKLATRIVAMGDARMAGDMKAMRAAQDDIEAMMRENVAQILDPNIPDWQKLTPAQGKTIRAKVFSLLAPEIARLKRAPKLTRPALQNMPLVNQP